MSSRRSLRPLRLGLGLVLLILVVLSLQRGRTGAHSLGDVVQGVLATAGMGERLPGASQVIVELRLWRVLVTVAVGAALALSGGLLQGVYRNGLAAPSVLGVSAGATLGASVAILIVGGYGPELDLQERAATAPFLVTLFGFVGAVLVVLLVTTLASRGGRISVPTLLLVGIAVNTCAAGLLAAIQSIALEDWEITRAIFSWTFGTLHDRSPHHVVVVWIGLALAALVIPFVALELDLFAGGEEDAEALGVRIQRVKVLALLAAALAAAVAIAVAGQIAFVGLVVPHLIRLLTGASHRTLLPLCLLGGPVFLLGTDFLQTWLLGTKALQPGVMMSIVGGPFFLLLLMRHRRSVESW